MHEKKAKKKRAQHVFRADKEPRAPRDGVIKKTTRATNPADYTLGRAKGTVTSSLKRKTFVAALDESDRRQYNVLKRLDATHEFVQRTDKFMEKKYRAAQRTKRREITDRMEEAYEAARAAASNDPVDARQDGRRRYAAAARETADVDVGESKLLRGYPLYHSRAVESLREQHLRVIDSKIPGAGRGITSVSPLRAAESFRGIKGVLLPGGLSGSVIREKCLQYLRRGSNQRRGQVTVPYTFYAFEVIAKGMDPRARHGAFLYTSPEIEPLCLVNVAPAGAVANVVIDTTERPGGHRNDDMWIPDDRRFDSLREVFSEADSSHSEVTFMVPKDYPGTIPPGRELVTDTYKLHDLWSMDIGP